MNSYISYEFLLMFTIFAENFLVMYDTIYILIMKEVSGPFNLPPQFLDAQLAGPFSWESYAGLENAFWGWLRPQSSASFCPVSSPSRPAPIVRNYFPETWLWLSSRAEYVPSDSVVPDKELGSSAAAPFQICPILHSFLLNSRSFLRIWPLGWLLATNKILTGFCVWPAGDRLAFSRTNKVAPCLWYGWDRAGSVRETARDAVPLLSVPEFFRRCETILWIWLLSISLSNGERTSLICCSPI